MLTSSGTEQLTQNRNEKMPVDTPQPATFEVIQTKSFFRLTEAVFDWPAPECNAKNLPQLPAVSARTAVRQEVFGSICGQATRVRE